MITRGWYDYISSHFREEQRLAWISLISKARVETCEIIIGNKGLCVICDCGSEKHPSPLMFLQGLTAEEATKAKQLIMETDPVLFI